MIKTESEGPYEHDMRGGGCSNYCQACNHTIGMAIAKDALLCGTGFVMEGKRVPPEDVYLSETEIKLQKVEKEFKELLSIAQELCDDLGDDIAEKFRDWKKARVI